MSASRARPRKGAGSRNAQARGNRWLLPVLFAGALGLVAVFIAIQTFGGSDSKIPSRVATGEGRVLGDADAPVTVIEYADFQCPVCKRAETSVISKIEEEYVQHGKVKIEFRMLPFIGQESFDAAQAAEAAREQGKFWEYHDALFNAQGRENSGAFKYDKLVALAREVGLDVPKFEATLTANTYLAAIQKEADEAHDAGITSTPTFFIGDRKIVGAQPYGKFQEAIDAELEKVGDAQ